MAAVIIEKFPTLSKFEPYNFHLYTSILFSQPCWAGLVICIGDTGPMLVMIDDTCSANASLHQHPQGMIINGF